MFSIYHKVSGELFTSRRGHSVFNNRSAAKNAFNQARDRGVTHMQAQKDWEMREVCIVPKAELEVLQKDAAWLSSLEDAGVDNWSGISFAHDLMKEDEE